MSKRKKHRNATKLAQKLIKRQDVNTPRNTPATRYLNSMRAKIERDQMAHAARLLEAQMTGMQNAKAPIELTQLLNPPDYVKYAPEAIYIDVVEEEGKHHAILMAHHKEKGFVEIYKHSEGQETRRIAVDHLSTKLPLVPVKSLIGDNGFYYPFYDENKGQRMFAARERQARRLAKQEKSINESSKYKPIRPYNPPGSPDTDGEVHERTEHQLVPEQALSAEVGDNG